MDSPNILVCPFCGEKSNWIDYHGNQYKEICPFCQRIIKGKAKKPEGSDAKKESITGIGEPKG